MNIIEDSIICGKAEGASFMGSVRPNVSTKKCPTNYVPCSEFTSPDNTICVKDTDDKDDVCPITKIVFQEFDSKDDAKAWASNDTYPWKFEDYIDDIYLFWTKDFDALPLQQTSIESSSPCMTPT